MARIHLDDLSVEVVAAKLENDQAIALVFPGFKAKLYKTQGFHFLEFGKNETRAVVVKRGRLYVHRRDECGRWRFRPMYRCDVGLEEVK